MGGIMEHARPPAITFAELRDMGVRGLLVYCADYHCSHSVAIGGEATASLSCGLFVGSVYLTR